MKHVAVFGVRAVFAVPAVSAAPAAGLIGARVVGGHVGCSLGLGLAFGCWVCGSVVGRLWVVAVGFGVGYGQSSDFDQSPLGCGVNCSPRLNHQQRSSCG